jgi:predicted transcriptional regulator
VTDTDYDNSVLLESATSIIAAFLAHNTIPKDGLPALIVDTFQSLAQAGQKPAPTEELKPAVPVKRSVQPDYIICLEDGKPFKSLKRHLIRHFNMSPQDYREKWGLPDDYPMIAPNYARARSELAKKMGLGLRAVPVKAVEAHKAVKSEKSAGGAKAKTSKKGERCVIFTAPLPALAPKSFKQFRQYAGACLLVCAAHAAPQGFGYGHHDHPCAKR